MPVLPVSAYYCSKQQSVILQYHITASTLVAYHCSGEETSLSEGREQLSVQGNLVNTDTKGT